MLNKKHLIVLLLFSIIAIGAISSVSASEIDDVSEIAEISQADEIVSASEISQEDVALSEENDDETIIQSPSEETEDNTIIQSPSEDPVLAEEGNSSVSPSITLSQSGTTIKNKAISVKVVDANTGSPISTKVSLSFLNSKSTVVKTLTLTTDANGQASTKVSISPGTYTVKASLSDSSATATLSNFKLTSPVKIKAPKVTTIFKSAKKFQVKLLDANNKAASGVKLKIKVYTGKKSKTYTVTTNSKGIATIKTSGLKLGKHKVIIKVSNSYYPAKALTSAIKINPRPVKIKVISKKEQYFSSLLAGVIDKKTKKLTDKVTVKLLIYTGKKYKTMKLVSGINKATGEHGIIGYVTNQLSVGKHKVKFIATGNYKGTKVSKLVIAKSAKKTYPIRGKLTKGKYTAYAKIKGKWTRIA